MMGETTSSQRGCGRQGPMFAYSQPGLQRGREPAPMFSPRGHRAERGEMGRCSRRREGSAVMAASERHFVASDFCAAFFCGAKAASDAAMMPPGMAATCCQGCVRKTALPWRRYRHAEAVFRCRWANRQASARKKPQTVPRSGARHGLRCAGATARAAFFRAAARAVKMGRPLSWIFLVSQRSKWERDPWPGLSEGIRV